MVGSATALIALPFDVDVDQHRRRGKIVVPDRVVHDLVVPLPLRRSSDRRTPGCRRTGCRPGGRRRSSPRSGSSTGRYTRPSSSSTVICVQTPVLPLVSATSRSPTCRCRTRPGVGIVWKVQISLPVLDIVGAHQTFGVVVGDDRHAFLERRADDHRVLHHQGRRVESGLTGFEIDLLAGARDHADLQIHHAVLAEGC